MGNIYIYNDKIQTYDLQPNEALIPYGIINVPKNLSLKNYAHNEYYAL